MKYLKKFENLNNPIEIGDYVICDEAILDYTDKEYMKAINFVSNNIGKYVKYLIADKYAVIQFENVPDDIKEYFSADDEFENCRNMYMFEIIMHSKSKEELESKLAADKYNL